MSSLENRIPPPFTMLIVAAAMWGASFFLPPLVMSGPVHYGLAIAFFLLGGLFGFPAFRAFGRAKTTIDPVHIERASALVTGGVYKFTRNPMYIGLTCLLLSWGVYLAVPASLVGPIFFALYITQFQIIPEERAMTEKFGTVFTEYKKRVRRWI